MTKLTAIITFRNEGIEIEKTIESILKTTKSDVDILLIDDNSDDGYDYENLINLYPVSYIKNKERKGVAESRNIGVRHSVTPFCLLLDGHMRFYENEWNKSLEKCLEKHSQSIICSRTVVIKKDENGNYINENGEKRIEKQYGATINLDYTKERCFRHAWNYNKIEEDEDNLCKIPCVLGAAYAFSKEWWENIRGLDGLIVYGLDEAMMSIKTWMFGGKCFLKNDWNVGHIYRNEMPFSVSQWEVAYNEYILSSLFSSSKNELDKYIDNIRKRISVVFFDKIVNKIDNKYIEEYRKFIDENKQITFEEFKEKINKLVFLYINTKKNTTSLV